MLDRARDIPEQSLQALSRALSASGPMIVGNALKYRFTSERGPFPYSQNKLGRVTGRLRQSITSTPPQIQAGTSSVTIGFGSNVRYFAIHEFGFTGNVTVKAHTRKAHTVPKLNLSRLAQDVRSHSRYLKLQARAPMATELRDPRTEAIVVENARRQIQKVLDALDGTAAPESP